MTKCRLKRAIQSIPDFSEMNADLCTSMMHARILNSIFSSGINTNRNLLMVKGGVAMKAVTKSERHTNDIDFSADPKINRSTLNNHMEKAINHALSSGMIEDYHITRSGVDASSSTPKWKIVGRVAGSEDNVTIKLEVSTRDKMPPDEIVSVEFMPPSMSGVSAFKVTSYTPLAIAAAKVAALLDSKRYKPRDVYDLFVLIEMKIESPVPMLAAIGKTRLTEMLSGVWNKVAAFSFEDYMVNVEPYLPKEVSGKIDQKAWEDMQLSVGAKVEVWLSEALDISDDEIERSELADHYEELKSRHHAKFRS